MGRPRRLEIGTAVPAGSFLYTQKSGGQSFLLKGWRLESSVDDSHCTWDVLEGWRLELPLGSFLCIQLLKDDSWLELEKWGYFSLSLNKVRWKNLRSFRWLIVECLIDEV